ncbi:MAG: phosphatidylserine decarboxylase [Clostridia bacterium]|nr:phosphatidylserine decarboxylase [Clostridia bacterium]
MIILLTLVSCGQNGRRAEDGVTAHAVSSDLVRTDEHEDITWDLIQMAEHDPALKAMLEESVAQAYRMNPDPDTNPVSDLESYYAFLDRCYLCLPWEIHPAGKYSSLYDQIDQGMGCLYFVCNQPLKELEDKGYYHNSLMYHEPFRSWFIQFLSGSGAFLNTEASWCEEYYRTALANPDFHLDDGTYESPENWKSFNDFFARRLKDPSVRPIAEPENAGVVILPADSVPQGVWQIDGNSKIIAEDPEVQAGIVIKTGSLTDVSVLLGNSAYKNAFADGSMTHTFLDVNDYHRYHVPVSGTVKEVLLLPQDDAPGGVITWNSETGKYIEYYSDTFGWQSIETRGAVIIETESGGLVAVVPVGMCQVSSVNFEETIVPGAKVKKGDPLGFFLFGGSDIVMLFSEDLDFAMTAEAGEHFHMGQAYGTIRIP